jgi:WD40 repeat protein
VKILRGDWGQALAVTYTPDGAYLASLHLGTLCFWRLPEYGLARDVHVYAGAAPHRLSFGENRLLLAQTCWDVSAVLRHLVRVRGRPEGMLPPVALAQTVADYLWLTLSADGRSILGTGWRAAAPGSAHLLRWSPDGELQHLRRLRRLLLPFLVASPDGHSLAGGQGASVYLVDIETGQETAALPHRGDLGDMAFSPDGRLLAVVASRSVWLWDVEARRVITRFPAFRRKLPCVAFHPAGRWLGAAGRDGEVRLWDVAGPREVNRLDLDVGPVHGLAFAPDGMTAAACGDKGIAVWDLE